MGSDAVRRGLLPNEIPVVVEQIPTVRSAAIGVWVAAGSRNESAREKGISHFVEHMLFKGTETRDARQIASFLESVGGHLDAFTSRELTCFYARVLDEYLEKAVDILADIVCNSVFSPGEVQKEKKVITEEIMNFEDNPDELIHDLLARAVWPDHPLGGSILGSLETVERFDSEMLKGYFRKHYGGPRVVVAAAGNLSYEWLMEKLPSVLTLPGGLGSDPLESPGGAEAGGIHYHERDLGQEYLCVGARGVSYRDPRRFPLLVLSTLLGGGMSSRLFQKVREKQALAYAVYSYADFHRDSGLFATFLGVRPEQSARALAAVLDEYRVVTEHPVEQEELESAKAQLKGGLLMGLESMTSRMSRLAKNEIYHGRVVPVDELVDSIESVTPEAVMELAREVLDPDRQAIVSLGSVRAGELEIV